MKICYITSHGIAEWIAFKDDRNSILQLQFTPKCDGAVSLGDTIYKVKNGNVSIPLDILPNGEYRPKLEADTGVFIAEGFCKTGGMITMLKTEEAAIRRLVSRCHSLEKICGTLREKVAHLEDMCQGHKIFNYERTEK